MTEQPTEAERPKNTEPEKVYTVKKAEQPIEGYALAASLIAFAAVGAITFGIISFNRPELITQASENLTGTLALISGLTVIGVILTSMAITMSNSTFAKSSNPEVQVRFNSILQKIFAIIVRVASGMQLTMEIESKEDQPKGNATTEAEAYSYGAPSRETPFEQYISEILRSLSAYAASSEITAQKLLDKGVGFMAGGLAFYVIAIVIWQVFANLTKPDTHVMYIGMVACSLTFIVIEFLAAWFFKQYRYYVEVSLSCLRVRSVYDRYLLAYYALKAFKEDGEVEARDKIIEALKEDVKWPTYKGAASNDFNYMLESMGAAHTSLEKIRKIFKDSGKGKG